MKQIMYNKLKEHKLAGWLVFSAMRLEALAEINMLKPMGLTASTFRILMTLHSLGPQFPSELIATLGGSKSNMTQRLNWLFKNEYITLSPQAKGDKRKVVAAITKAGSLKLEMTSKLVEKNKLYIENYFTKKEAQEFLQLLRKLNAGLDKCQLQLNKYYEKK